VRHPLFTDGHDELRASVRAFVESEPAPRRRLGAFAATGLAVYKRPREIRFTGWLPKSPIGKVLKKDLRAGLAWA
jgi:non-ribosomal peptide synthetase component E (peptide arylation enzyme)